MPADALFLHHMVNELSFLRGARIDKIYMPTYEEAVFFLRAADENVKLLISCGSNDPRCCIAKKTGENPDTPFSFLMHLRKHLTGGIINDVEQIPYERVLVFSVTSTNNMFEARNYRMYVELVGKFSNIILTENGKITDSAKHLPLDVTTRAVLPGLVYSLPPAQADKTDIGSREFFVKKVCAGYQGAGVRGYLQKNFIGFAPASLKEAVFRSGVDDGTARLNETDAGRLYDAFVSLIDDYRPALSEKDGKYTGFYPSPYGCENATYISFPTLSKALETYYESNAAAIRISARGKKLWQIVLRQLEHCAKNRIIFTERLEQNSDDQSDRITGDLLIANIYKISPGAESVTVDDYISGGTRTIKLDPALSPSRNAAAYYKKYEKAKNTAATTRSLLEKNSEKQDYLESLAIALQNAVTNADLDEIEREMEEQNLIKTAGGRRKSQKPGAPLSVVIDGYKVLIGKNNCQNDALVKKSKKNFLWLHAQKIHGSHAVIEAEDVPQEIINQAAAYCAYYSKASESANVPVDYTLVKYVRKPSGAPPGKVIYTNQQTVNVTPKRPPQ